MKYLIVMLGVAGVSMSPVLRRFSTAPSLILVLYRVAFAALILTPYFFLRHREELKQLKPRELLLCVCSGVFLGLHFSAYYESLRFTAIAAAAVLVNTETLFVTLGSVVFLKNRPSKQAWSAVSAAFLGSAIVAMADLGGGGTWRGNLLALLGALMGAAYTLAGTVCRRSGISTTVYTYFMYIAAALTTLSIALASGLPLTGYEPVNLLTTMGMAVFSTLLGHSLYSWGLKYLPASFISTAKLMESVFAAVWGLLFFSERPGILTIAGGTVVMMGIAVYTRSEQRE